MKRPMREPIPFERAGGIGRKRPLTYAEGQAAAGRRGGASTSKAKRRAAKVNLAKARVNRWRREN